MTLEGEHPRSLKYRHDFAATLPSGPGDVEGEVVFVGYAMTAPELNYDDFAGVDLKGKIALVVRGAPGVGAEIKPEYRTPDVKDANVAAHGGAGILYVVRPKEYRGNELQRKYSVMTPVKLPSVEVSREVASALLGQGFDLTKAMDEIDRQHKPHSVATGQRVRLKTQVDVDDQRPDRDVLGFLPGSDPKLQDRFVIICAHYDHMGVDADGQVFHGAYDNASGVATMLEAARALATDPPRISVLFAAWGAEESGMVGSNAYRNSPLFHSDKLVGVINLDAIGHADTVTVELSRTDKDAPRVFDFAQRLGVRYLELDQLGPSDGLTFSKLPVPVIQVVDEASADHIHILDDRPSLVDAQRLATLAQTAAMQVWWWGDHLTGHPLASRANRWWRTGSHATST